MNKNLIKALLIENNPGDARLIGEMLAEAKGGGIDLNWVDRLSLGLEHLAKGEVDVVLLDLGLPDSQGMDTLVNMLTQSPRIPVVVLTGSDDDSHAIRAVQLGAQDYLVKGKIDGNLLVRSLRYSIERHNLQKELEKARLAEKTDKEVHSFEGSVKTARTSVTAKLYGMAPLREVVPEIFGRLVGRYSELMERALEQQILKVEHHVSEGLRSMADEMGFLKAGPRDVVEVHNTVLREKSKGATLQKVQAYIEEGRIMAFELMGYLVSFYRNYSLGFWTPIDSRNKRGEKTNLHEGGSHE